MYWVSFSLFNKIKLVAIRPFYFNSLFSINNKYSNYSIIFNNYIYKSNTSTFNFFSTLSFNNTNYIFKFFGFYKKFKFYTLNINNSLYFKKILNLVYDLNLNKGNFIFIDTNYNQNLPLLNYCFGLKNLYIYKFYFFLKTDYIINNNWSYFYMNFLKKFNINLIIFLNINKYAKFLNLFKKFNKPICGLINSNTYNSMLDYPLYIKPDNSHIEQLIFFNVITQVFFNSYNYKNYINKIKFIKSFYILPNVR